MNISSISKLKRIISTLSPDELLYNSSSLNYVDGVKLALNKGADINYNYGITIINAIKNNNIEFIKYLIMYNPNINIPDIQNQICTSIAYYNVRNEKIKILLDYDNSNNAEHIMTGFYFNKEIFYYLLDKTDINMINDNENKEKIKIMLREYKLNKLNY